MKILEYPDHCPEAGIVGDTLAKHVAAKFLRHLLVDDNGAGVRGQVAIQVAPFHEFDAKCAQVELINSPELSAHSLFYILLSFIPKCISISPGASHRKVVTVSHFSYLLQIAQLFSKMNYLGAQCAGSLKQKHLLFIKADFFVQDEIHLSLDHHRADQQHDGDSELKNYQCTPER